MISRRNFLITTVATAMAGRTSNVQAAKVLKTTAVGDVSTPTFYRHDIGTAPGRLHEPSAGQDGSIWTSPLDGNLWRYHTPTGQVEIINLKKLTGRNWRGLHLWPIAHGSEVYLCTPKLPELWVFHLETKTVKQYAFPHANPSVYGGFVTEGWSHIYLYDTQHASVLKWNPQTRTGKNISCPYKLSGTLFMTFVDKDRSEIWGSTYAGNDIVRFDVKLEKWTGHFKCPLPKATPTAGGKVFGETLFISDHLNGRIVPLNITSGKWGDPIPVPGYRDWFGFLSGGFLFRNKLYIVHSTWTGGKSSIDGAQHHFIGSWSVFDPATRKFSRLDLPTRSGEQLKYLMSDYCATYDDHLFILAVNQKQPKTVIVLQSKPLS